MKTKTLINVPILAISLMLSWLSISVARNTTGSVSASIQATARVVSSLGVAAIPAELPSTELCAGDDWWLWMSDGDNLQIQVEADGRILGSQVLNDESAPADVSVLERHRRNGLIRHRLRIDFLPAGTDTCTVTIVNPTN